MLIYHFNIFNMYNIRAKRENELTIGQLTVKHPKY